MGTNTSITESGLTCGTSYTRYVWAYNNCDVSGSTILNRSNTNDPPSSPVAATHISTPVQIEWKWLTVSGATSYRWNTIYDSIGAIDIGNVIYKDETGLACNSLQDSYVWAVGPCGISVVTILSISTLPDPPASPVAGVHVATPTQIEWKWHPVFDGMNICSSIIDGDLCTCFVSQPSAEFTILFFQNYLHVYQFGRLMLRFMGWKITCVIPLGTKNCVIAVAPHTSYWDFVIGRLACLLGGGRQGQNPYI